MALQSQKTIFIVCFHLLAARNILTTDVFPIIKNRPNCRVVLFVPAYKKFFYEENYSDDNVLIEGLEEAMLSNLASFRLFKFLSSVLVPAYTAKLRAMEKMHKSQSLSDYIKYFLSRLITIFLSQSKFIKNTVRKFDYYFSACGFLDKYFTQYRPDLVFVTDVFSPMDVLFVQAARRNRILSVGMVRSWDNTTTRGLMRAIPDKLIVNNEIIKEEAINLQNINTDFFIGGIPQFDIALRHFESNRNSFFKKIGANPLKRLILLAPAGIVLSDTDWQVCELLRQSIIDKKLVNVQFLIRSHPANLADLVQFNADENFIIDRPGTHFYGSRDGTFTARRNFFKKTVPVGIKLRGTEIMPEDSLHLIESLYHTDIIIHVSSSIGLDSLVFDKPQIMIEFDGWETRPYLESVRRYHDEDHMAKYIKTGAARLAHNFAELVDLINQYLKNPRLDSEKRQMALKEQYYFVDGQSGKRIGDFVTSHL